MGLQRKSIARLSRNQNPKTFNTEERRKQRNSKRGKQRLSESKNKGKPKPRGKAGGSRTAVFCTAWQHLCHQGVASEDGFHGPRVCVRQPATTNSQDKWACSAGPQLSRNQNPEDLQHRGKEEAEEFEKRKAKVIGSKNKGYMPQSMKLP
jgi:hypothetical protein